MGTSHLDVSMKARNTGIDASKRRTIKRLIGTAGASSALVAIPSLAEQTGDSTRNSAGQPAISINATLVSIPGTPNETLLLKNITNKTLTINQLQHAVVTFDGESIDCGAVCDTGSIVIPANADVMVHFSSLSLEHQPTISGNGSAKPLNVQALVSRLPEGTRVIPLQASIQGTTAKLI